MNEYNGHNGQQTYPYPQQILNHKDSIPHHLLSTNTYSNDYMNGYINEYKEDELLQLQQMEQNMNIGNHMNNHIDNQCNNTYTNQLYIDDKLVKFKKYVKEWIAIDDDIRVLQTAIKDKKKKQLALNPYITKYLEENDIKHIVDKSGTINYTKTETKKSLSKEYMTSKIAEYIKDIDKSKKLVEYLMDKRETVQKFRLRRIINKNNKNEQSIDLA